MKKTLFFVCAVFVAASVNAQLVVEESGKVAVGYEGTSAVASDFSVNSVGLSTATAHIESFGKTYGLYVNEALSNVPTPVEKGTEGSPVYYQYGVYSTTAPIDYGYTYGTYGNSCASTTMSGRTFGVCGIAGNATAGYNYGVFGVLNGTRNGAGVFGSSVAGETGYNTSGRYAGFFHGDVYSTGSITGNIVNRSDYRLKTNIVSLSEALPNSLDAIMRLNPVQFKYKNRQVDVDANGKPIYMWQGDEPTYTHTHFGFIAQEIQELFPNIVYEGASGDGYLSVSYSEIIPVLVRAIQELKTELSETRKAAGIGDENVTPVEATAMRGMTTELFQNDPNPFKEKTVIACTVAESVRSAMLYVYDMQGKQVAEYPVDGRGKTSVTIEGGSLDAGMYLYSLIADGKVVDTKRMILTK